MGSKETEDVQQLLSMEVMEINSSHVLNPRRCFRRVCTGVLAYRLLYAICYASTDLLHRSNSSGLG